MVVEGEESREPGWGRGCGGLHRGGENGREGGVSARLP